jgi:hypothetical protein
MGCPLHLLAKQHALYADVGRAGGWTMAMAWAELSSTVANGDYTTVRRLSPRETNWSTLAHSEEPYDSNRMGTIGRFEHRWNTVPRDLPANCH